MERETHTHTHRLQIIKYLNIHVQELLVYCKRVGHIVQFVGVVQKIQHSCVENFK